MYMRPLHLLSELSLKFMRQFLIAAIQYAGRSVGRAIRLDLSTALEMTGWVGRPCAAFCHFDQAKLKAERVEKSGTKCRQKVAT